MNFQSDPKFKKSLNISYYKGMFGCIMTGLTQDYFAPLLLFLGGSVQSVGFMNGSFNLAASLVQLTSADLAEKFKSRKKLIGIFIFLQIFVLCFLGWMAWNQVKSQAFVIVSIVMFTSLGALTNPAWVSLITDLVSPYQRGSYFGWRMRNLGLVTVLAAFISGAILHYFAKINLALGFCLIFMLAALARLVSFIILKRIEEPRLKYDQENYFTFIQFFSRVKESNFVKFVLYVAAMNFAVNLAAPFFTVFMIKDLGFNYILYTVVNMTAPLTLYLVVRRWGRHADKVGNLKIVHITGKMIAFIPLLWMISQHPFFLISAEILSGFLWAGFNLCSANFIYDACSPQKRTRCIAYFSVVNGVALALGALIGGSLVGHLPPLKGYQILSLFLISSVLRLTVSWIGPLFIKEVRSVEKVRGRALFLSIIGARPLLDR